VDDKIEIVTALGLKFELGTSPAVLALNYFEKTS
jgi:hypothetical protein